MVSRPGNPYIGQVLAVHEDNSLCEPDCQAHLQRHQVATQNIRYHRCVFLSNFADVGHGRCWFAEVGLPQNGVRGGAGSYPHKMLGVILLCGL